MHLSAEQLPDNSDYYAFRYGPIVLAAKYGKKKISRDCLPMTAVADILHTDRRFR
jgi:hypothetical protein